MNPPHWPHTEWHNGHFGKNKRNYEKHHYYLSVTLCYRKVWNIKRRTLNVFDLIHNVRMKKVWGWKGKWMMMCPCGLSEETEAIWADSDWRHVVPSSFVISQRLCCAIHWRLWRLMFVQRRRRREQFPSTMNSTVSLCGCTTASTSDASSALTDEAVFTQSGDAFPLQSCSGLNAFICDDSVKTTFNSPHLPSFRWLSSKRQTFDVDRNIWKPFVYYKGIIWIHHWNFLFPVLFLLSQMTWEWVCCVTSHLNTIWRNVNYLK